MEGETSNDDILCQEQNKENVWEEGIEVVAFGYSGLHLNCAVVALFRVQMLFSLMEISDGGGTGVIECKSPLHAHSRFPLPFSPLME